LALIKSIRASGFIEPEAPLRLYNPVPPLIPYTPEHLKILLLKEISIFMRLLAPDDYFLVAIVLLLLRLHPGG
jgi:hypothetical protein